MKKIVYLITLSIVLYAGNNIAELTKKAKEGDVNAISKLAYIYENGIGVQKDLALAKRYYLQAKELGNKDAIIALALLQLSSNNQKITYNNNSIKIKIKSALNYSIEIDDLKKIVEEAKKNDSEALFTLATIYDNGYGVIKQNRKMALLLYIKSAKLGNKKAKEVLALKRETLKSSKQ